MLGPGKLLKIYIGESDAFHGEPLYHAIVKKLRSLGLAGATTIRGIEGYGAGSVIHSTRILRLSEDLPVVIEVVDRPEKIAEAAEAVRPMLSGGHMLVTQDVEILRYSKGE